MPITYDDSIGHPYNIQYRVYWKSFIHHTNGSRVIHREKNNLNWIKSVPNCQSRLWQQANVLTNFSFLSWISSLGKENLKFSKQSLMMSLFADSNSFIKPMLIAPGPTQLNSTQHVMRCLRFLCLSVCQCCYSRVLFMVLRCLETADRRSWSWSWGLRSWSWSQRSCRWSWNHVLNQLFIIFHVFCRI